MNTQAKRSVGGFTLVETTMVLCIVVIVLGALIPLVGAVSLGGYLRSNANDVAAVMAQARSYAMARHTYVYLGMEEVDSQNPSSSSGVGKLVLAMLASSDGTRPFGSTPGFLGTNDVTPLGKSQYAVGVHITNAAALQASTNMTARPGLNGSGATVTDLSSNACALSFYWPVTGTPQYIFTNIIEFDPQGVARIQSNSTVSTAVSDYLELPLVSVSSDVPQYSTKQAAIQINGLTGAIRVYMP